MGVKVEFNSGKEIVFKTATGYKFSDDETFKSKSGKKSKGEGWVIFFGKGKGSIHYHKNKVSRISQI